MLRPARSCYVRGIAWHHLEDYIGFLLSLLSLLQLLFHELDVALTLVDILT